MHPEKSAVMLVRWWNYDKLQRVRSLRASTHPGVICRGRRHSGLEYPDEKSNGTSYRTLLRSKTFDRFRNYQSITIEMKEFFDRTRKKVIVMIVPDELLVM